MAKNEKAWGVKMRDVFILACRIAGLALVCYGLLVILSFVPELICEPNIAKLCNLSSASGNSDLNNDVVQLFRAASGSVWWQVLLRLLFTGLLPLALGFYLMRSGAFFINLCYPPEQNQAAAVSMDQNGNAMSEEEDGIKAGNRRFMPPGMS